MDESGQVYRLWSDLSAQEQQLVEATFIVAGDLHQLADQLNLNYYSLIRQLTANESRSKILCEAREAHARARLREFETDDVIKVKLLNWRRVLVDKIMETQVLKYKYASEMLNRAIEEGTVLDMTQCSVSIDDAVKELLGAGLNTQEALPAPGEAEVVVEGNAHALLEMSRVSPDLRAGIVKFTKDQTDALVRSRAVPIQNVEDDDEEDKVTGGRVGR